MRITGDNSLRQISYTEGLFKKKYTLEEREKESSRILEKYPDRVPIIVEISKKGIKDFPPLDKQKFLVPRDLTIGQFSYVIRKRVKLNPEQAMYLMFGNKLVSSSQQVGDLYENEKDEDLFLYCCIAQESTFGGGGALPPST